MFLSVSLCANISPQDLGLENVSLTQFPFKIGSHDLTALGVTRSADRARLLSAVAELAAEGATQVHIRAAGLQWRMLARAEQRDIPAALLRKMVRIFSRGPFLLPNLLSGNIGRIPGQYC